MSNVVSFLANSDKHRLSVDQLATRIIVNYLNKRGYDVHEATGSDPAEKSRASTASTASSVSSVVASLREPKHGQTPLHIAVRKRDLPVMEALLKTEGIEHFINHQDNNGNTALHFAAAASKHEESHTMVRLFLEAGANVNVTNHKFLAPTAVHVLTLTKDDPRILCMLIDCGANPSANVDGNTLLHIAARRGFPEVAYKLVRSGASPSAKNQNGLMCVELASNFVRGAMFKGITSAQPFVTTSHRCRCMLCNKLLYGQKRRKFCILMHHLLGRIKKENSENCYHCGLLYCKKCLVEQDLTCPLPTHLYRSKEDNLSRKFLCYQCHRIIHKSRH
uniref:Myosinlike protein putative n=1 Tax=Albugo laibachii Nc14 TaxID=890382 RepID=F0W0K1_9STRA|nr:myosinlike protein putative [Albugo laibachii Nc14]|eukprot:CCA14573.1 myosinlike protein putative [Albugo laibachii Nc14]